VKRFEETNLKGKTMNLIPLNILRHPKQLLVSSQYIDVAFRNILLYVVKYFFKGKAWLPD